MSLLRRLIQLFCSHTYSFRELVPYQFVRVKCLKCEHETVVQNLSKKTIDA